MSEAFEITSYGKVHGNVFRPPLPNPAVIGTCKVLLPLLMQFMLDGLKVRVDEASLEKLSAIQGERCLLLPNHPTEWDPWVMFALSRMLGENFYYLAAREVFDYHGGKQGLLLQRLGCYSVVRGASDRDSFKTTKRILMENPGRLVIFIEGEISTQNDTLLPLESGVVQLGFLSLNEIYKQNGKQINDLPSLYIAPIALKYVYDRDGLEEAIQESLDDLAGATGVNIRGMSFFEGIRRVGEAVLNNVAGQFGYVFPEGATVDERIEGLKDYMLAKLEQVVNLDPDRSLSILDRVRRLRNMLDTVLKDVPDNMTPYEERLYQHRVDVLQHFYLDLDRIVNFIAIYDGYIQPDVLNDRYVEDLIRLEKEVFGESRLAHPRTAVVHVMDPINIEPYFKDYLQDKKSITQELTDRIEQQLTAVLTREVSRPPVECVEA